MLTTIAWAREGTTKAEIIERLRREETGRGLHFDDCLLTVGASHNRAPSGQAWRPGEVLSIGRLRNGPSRGARRQRHRCWRAGTHGRAERRVHRLRRPRHGADQP